LRNSDVTRLSLTAAERLLLSRVDGKHSLAEIAERTTMTLSEVFPHADRLVALGAVSVDPLPGRETPAETRPGASSHEAAKPEAKPHDPSLDALRAWASTAGDSAPPSGKRPSTAHAGPPGPEKPPIDEAARTRIVEVHARLAHVDHYALLGVSRDADKTAIKRAYFALAGEFHPDRHFGKNLRELGGPLQSIFKRITEAHDTLVNRARKAAYDTTLPPAPPPPTPRPPETKVTQAPPAPVPRAESPAPAPPADAKPAAPAPPADAKPAAPAPRPARAPAAIPPAAPPSSPARAPAAVASAQATPNPRPTNGAPAASPTTSGTRPRPSPENYALFHMYRATKQQEVRTHVRVFVEAAEAAMSRGDPVAAANNYRLALQNGEDPMLRAKLRAVEGAAIERIHVRATARARAAESNEEWADAAAFFAQANGAKQEAWTAERAANALRRAGGDLRVALQLAEQAVAAEPEMAPYHVTLGEVCLAAKLRHRALAEAERALALDPTNRHAKALADAIKRA
jgi:hypothetical protein